MEQTNTQKPVRKTTKKSDSSAIRFDKTFMRQIARLVDRANKKQFGRKIKAKDIIKTLFTLADESIIEKVVKSTQEDSLTLENKKEIFMRENLSKFEGNKEDFEQKMMELMSGFLSQNRT